MAWQYPVTAPFPWTDGVNIAHAVDFAAIASDIQTHGGPVNANGYGLAGAAFLTLTPGDLPGVSYTVTAASWSGGVVTLTIGANNLQVGQHFTLTGVTPTAYNNGATNGSTTNPPDYVVATTPTNQITFALATNPGTWSSGGTVLVDGTASPGVGMLATNISGTLQQWNGSAWVSIGSGSSAVSVQSVANPWIGSPTTSRALNTVYQNTTSKPIFVNVSVNISSADTITAYSDSASTPTTVVGQVALGSGAAVYEQLSFIVLPSNYYKVSHGGATTIIVWGEWS